MKPLVKMKLCCMTCIGRCTPKTRAFFKRYEARRARRATKKVEEA